MIVKKITRFSWIYMYPPEHRKVVFGMPSVYMDVHLNGCTDFIHIQYLKVHPSLSHCLVNMNMIAPETEAPQMGPQKQMAVLSKLAVI
jgi:hypothetical protein